MATVTLHENDTLLNNESLSDKNIQQSSQPDQLNQTDEKHVSPRDNKESTLKSSIVISTTHAEDLNKNVIQPKPEEVLQGLVSLHSKVDKLLSRSTVFSAQGSHVTSNAETPLRASPSSSLKVQTVYSEAKITDLNPITNEVRTLASKIASALSQSQHFSMISESPIKTSGYVTSTGYEVKTLASVEQALSRTMRYEDEHLSNSHLSYYQSSNSALYATQPLFQDERVLYSTPYSAKQTVTSQSFRPGYDAERLDSIISHIQPYETLRSSAPQTAPRSSYSHNTTYEHNTRQNYYCGDVSNDRDSIILDYLENQPEPEHEDYIEYDEQEDPRVKIVGKKNENVKSSKPANQKDNSELVLKGPYSQRKRDRISADQAKRHFEKSNQIEDFDFERSKAK